LYIVGDERMRSKEEGKKFVEVSEIRVKK